MMVVKIFSYAFVFYGGFRLGRVSMKNYLNQKRQELYSYRDRLLEIEKSLELKDKQIREKWQTMVSDFASYQAAANPSMSGRWTELDDRYLQSWDSAEK